MAEVHDTTEAVLEALKRGDPVYRPFATFSAARTAIEADRKALAEAGYVIVKPVPPEAISQALRVKSFTESEVLTILQTIYRLGLPIEVTE
jgi:hypothetical protein